MIILVQTNKRLSDMIFFPSSNRKHRSLPESDNAGEL